MDSIALYFLYTIAYTVHNFMEQKKGTGKGGWVGVSAEERSAIISARMKKMWQAKGEEERKRVSAGLHRAKRARAEARKEL